MFLRYTTGELDAINKICKTETMTNRPNYSYLFKKSLNTFLWQFE